MLLIKLKSRRFGKILISKELVRSKRSRKVISDAFSAIDFLPFRIEAFSFNLGYSKNAFEYVGISPLFSLVTEGNIIPIYELSIGEDGKVSILNP